MISRDPAVGGGRQLAWLRFGLGLRIGVRVGLGSGLGLGLGLGEGLGAGAGVALGLNPFGATDAVHDADAQR